MSRNDALDPLALDGPFAGDERAQKRRLANALWQPVLQFKLLLWMLGSTVMVAVILGATLYAHFSDLIAMAETLSDEPGHPSQMIGIQLTQMFRYGGALFLLYVLLLATACMAYTHRLLGPFRRFTRHVDKLVEGDYADRIQLREGDLELYGAYAERLNVLTDKLENESRISGNAASDQGS